MREEELPTVIAPESFQTEKGLVAEGLKYPLVSGAFLAHHGVMDFAGWPTRLHAEKNADFKRQIHAGKEPEGWFLVRFQ